jgi:aldose 1-epimerase
VVSRAPFGTTPDGAAVDLFTLRSPAGVTVAVATYGAIVQRLLAPDRDGDPVDVVLGFATLDEYVAGNEPRFGAVVGRYANRIAHASFTLGGTTYSLSRNEGENSLHGGVEGFATRVWEAVEATADGREAAVALRYVSPDGEMGFPGTLTTTARYALRADGSIRLDLRATTDRATVVNLTNHTYWNLAGESSGSTEGHLLEVRAERYLAADAALIPTGEILPVAGTLLDFREPAPLEAAGDLDVGYVVDRSAPGSLALAAELHEPSSGRTLTVLTTEPQMHVYSGAGLDDTGLGKSGRPHRAGDGVALEAQHYPDSPNHPEFPSTVLLPGETFASTTVWRLSAR